LTTGEEPSPRRLAIIGAGSSGLVTLKLAIEALEGWEIVCYERTAEATGSWGNPYEGFVSTSTKYTTQFACHRKFDDHTAPRGVEDGREFFRDDEYGRYLEDFVEEYQLQVHLRTSTRVQKLEKGPAGWRVWTEGKPEEPETFDSVVLCTGLAERPKTIDAPVEVLQSLEVHAPVRDKTIVVIGGGESAVDFANRLAEPSLENRVYLALSRGIRVSPRYHPIRGVPSDFLRTRLLLSIHESIRNAVGQKFVEARIKHQELFERFFRSGRRSLDQARTVRDKKRYWAAKLTERAKDDLFNMFHNKSDDFLDAVGEGRIEIIGGAVDDGYQRYAEFEGGGVLEIASDYLVPKIGYTSYLEVLSGGRIRASDFYLGCVHVEYDDLFLIGFARPIIGSIPPIS